LRVSKVSLSVDQEIIGFGVECEIEIPFNVTNIFKGDEMVALLVVCLELFKGHHVFQSQEILDYLVATQLSHLHQFAEEHLEDHHPFAKVLIVVAPILTLLGNWGHRDAGVQPLQCFTNPFKIRVSPLNSFSEKRSVDEVRYIGLFEHSALFFFEFCHKYL
jgi:hypothetical protein